MSVAEFMRRVRLCEKMAEENGPVPPPSNIWLPSNDFYIDAPNCSKLWYAHDQKLFSALGKQRQVLIRASLFEEFPRKLCSASAPPLWILVAKFGEWHLRVPIWRGPEFFRTTLLSDAAVMLTVADCVSLGGYDPVAVEELRAHISKNVRPGGF